MQRSAQSGRNPLRVVLDTNVVVSSVVSRTGAPARLIDAWRTMRLVPVASPAILDEIRATLSYPRIRRKYAISDEAIGDLMGLFARDAMLVPGEVTTAGAVPEDPSDEVFLACAVEGRADLIVSGDRHLLKLRVYRGVPIVSARQLADQLGLE